MKPPSSEILDDLRRTETQRRREHLQRALAKAIARIERRIAALRGDMAAMQAAEAAARHAPLFVAEAARAARGATVIRAVDWASGEPEPIEMTIDPAKSALGQVDALFKRARRLKGGNHIVHERLEKALGARGSLAEVAVVLERPEADLDALEGAARTAAPRDFQAGLVVTPTRSKDRQAGLAVAPTRSMAARALGARPPHRTFRSVSGAPIYVGRGAAHNDALTLHVARPHDLWMHARGRKGAHVVVPLEKGASCPADVLVEAGHLAAHFSEARDERVVEILYAQRRYVRKPRGSAPGAVVVDREKVIVLRKDDDVLRRLLEREAGAAR
jgi:predicted ribosome quality control (RQC) complex YloA/Tae2 family protein